MPTHTDIATPEEESQCAPRSASMVGSARACELYGAALTGRPQQRCCSARCRAGKCRHGRVPLAVAEAKEIRAKLAMILETAYEAKATLRRYGGR